MVIALLAFAAPAPSANAGGLDFGSLGVRAIGRAGATTVSEDGGPALLTNPAGMARRDGWRLQLGMSFHDSDGTLRIPDALLTPTILDRGPASSGAAVAIQGPVGPIIAGIAYLDLGHLQRALPRPLFNQPPDQIALLSPHRYGGLTLDYHRRAWVAGAAMRASSWLGIGLSFGLAQVFLAEERHIWAGLPGRDSLDDATRDLALALQGQDRAVPTASAGALIAPLDVPMEMALGVTYSAAAHLSGIPNLTATRDTAHPAPELVEPATSATLAGWLTARAGIRYLGERLLLEAGGEITLYTGNPAVWTVRGIAIHDESGAIAELTRIPALPDHRAAHGTVRMAADIELVAGFLWLTTGYAFRTSGSRTGYLSPAHADLGGHTLAIGAEGQWSDVTFTIGYSRTLSRAAHVNASNIDVVSPFATTAPPIAPGIYDSTRDSLGAALELAWY